MSAESKALMKRFYDEVINQKNLDLLDELVAEDFVEHEEFPGLPTRGPDAPRAAMQMFQASFPDLRFETEDMIAEGDKVAVVGTMSGTHEGEFMGMPATNKTFKIRVIDVIEFKDGKAVAHWGLTDQGALMQQLGLMPEM